MRMQPTHGMPVSARGMMHHVSRGSRSEATIADTREGRELLESIRLAKKELDASREILESATDSDLIDYAIYSLKAAERRYAYLLRQVKELEQSGHWVI